MKALMNARKHDKQWELVFLQEWRDAVPRYVSSRMCVPRSAIMLVQQAVSQLRMRNLCLSSRRRIKLSFLHAVTRLNRLDAFHFLNLFLPLLLHLFIPLFLPFSNFFLRDWEKCTDSCLSGVIWTAANQKMTPIAYEGIFREGLDAAVHKDRKHR